MKCNKNKCFIPDSCGCDFGAKIFGSCNTAKITLDESKPETLNWTEISVPEILYVPRQKPDIEHIDQVHAKAEITCVKLIETPYLFEGKFDIVNLNQDNTIADIVATDVSVYVGTGNANIPFYTQPNEEGTCLTGRKLIVEGVLKQKVVYTADVDVQSVHSAHYEIPFSAFVIPYAKIEPIGDVTPLYENIDVLVAGTAEKYVASGDIVPDELILYTDTDVYDLMMWI